MIAAFETRRGLEISLLISFAMLAACNSASTTAPSEVKSDDPDVVVTADEGGTVREAAKEVPGEVS